MDIAEEAVITKGATNVTLATRKPHLGLPDKWGPLLPWAAGAKWLWDHNLTEIRVLSKLYRFLPAGIVDRIVNAWSSMWARRHGIPEWRPVGMLFLYPLTLDVKFSRDVAYVFRTRLVEPIRNKDLYVSSSNADHRTLQVAGIHAISGSEVILTNNVVLHPKMVVCATGWDLELNCLPSDRANKSFSYIQSKLFCRFWDIDYPGLAFVSLSNGFMCATENANLVSQAVAQALLGDWTPPSMGKMVSSRQTSLIADG